MSSNQGWTSRGWLNHGVLVDANKGGDGHERSAIQLARMVGHQSLDPDGLPSKVRRASLPPKMRVWHDAYAASHDEAGSLQEATEEAESLQAAM